MKLRVSGQLEISTIEEGQPRLIFNVSVPGGIKLKDIAMLVLPNDHKVTASIQPVDAKGNPASIDGLPQWTSSSPAIATVTPLPADGSGVFAAEIIPGDALGTCQINVTADADLGAGTETISGILDVQVVGGKAVGFQISTGAPEPIVS